MKARKIQSRAASAPMFSLSSIGAAVAMALIATGGAHAAETSVTTTVGPVYSGAVNGTAMLNSGQPNSGNVTATINNVTGGTTATGTSLNPNPVTASTTANLIGATATGDAFSNTIGTLPATPVNNAASLGLSTNTGVISSTVSNSKLLLESSTFQTGSVVNADNTISAATTLNSGSSKVSGTASASATPVTGTSVLTYPAGAPLFDAKGNLVVTTLQSATGKDSSALVQNNLVDLLLTTNTASPLTTAAALERNSISAVLKGNSASNTAEIVAGGAPSFAGSAVVSNLQVNGNGVLAAMHSATNTGSVILGAVSAAPGGSNVLQGSLSVQGNSIASAATGNEALGATAGTAGNRIVIGGVSVAGSGTPATAANNSTHAGGGVTSNVNADLVITNSQGNLGVDTFSETTGAQIRAGVQSIDGGSVTLAGNSVTAAATGNTASSAIASGQNAASFSGTSAVANQQANVGANASAFLNPSVIAAQTGEVLPGTGQTQGSSVTVSNNTSAATAQGNQISQSLSLDANTVALGNAGVVLTGGTSSDGRVSATGAATLTNLQGNYNSSAGAINGTFGITPGSQILLTASGGGAPVANSTLTLASNRQEAVALGNGATNALTLNGNSVGTGAGIASVQMGDNASFVGVGLFNPEARITVNGGVAGGSVALTDNLQRGIAYGNSASNTLGVNAGNLAVAPGVGAASTITVNAASGLPFDNTAAKQPTVSAAYGILNDQSVQATVNAAVTGPNTLSVNVNGGLTSGSVANDRNAYVAAAYGNDAASGLTLAVNNVSGAGASVANVTNAQTVAGAGTVISAIAGGGTPVRTVITGAVDTSSVSSSGNTAQALVYGNRATGNTVKVTGNNIDTAGPTIAGATLVGGVLSTNAAFSVQNAQSAQGTVSAQRSGGATVRTSIDGTVTGSKVNAGDNTSMASATGNGAVNGVSIDAVGVSTTTAVQNLQRSSATVTSLTGQEGPSLNLKDGVQVVLGGNVTNSQVAVDGNAVGGSATGNAATNSIAVKGNVIAVGSGLPVGGAGGVPGTTLTVADHALSNIQLVTSAVPISSKVAGAFGVDTVPGAVISGATLSVSGNTQSAKAVANTATNSIALTATDVSARSALQSGQTSLAAVQSRSFTQAFAPASVSDSSVRIAGNSNSALSVINDVTNKVAVVGGTSGGSVIPAIVAQGVLLPGLAGALGDQVIVNRQSASTSASSTADTAFYNEDRTVPPASSTGVVNSSFAITGNTTASEATANRATNAVSLSGGATQSAKTAVLNAQTSSAAVTGNANSVAQLTLTGSTALSGSSATLDNNSVGGAATGNAATNSIDVKGSTASSGPVVPAVVATGPASGVLVVADHALANVQTSTGTVSSTVTGSVGISTAALSTIADSTLSISNNSQSARAVGNTALNSVSVAGANVPSRTALQSTQSGTAAVTASSVSTLFAPVASSGSSIRLSGNSNTALGVINDVTNTLAVAATNTTPLGATGAVSLIETGSADNVVATGDHLLSNRQTASSTVSSTATTSLANDDRFVPNTAGLSSGSLTISGNSTVAEAAANRATNTASVASDAVQGASVGIVNTQGSTAGVTATASTVATVGLSGAAPLNGSSVSLDGNTTSALARGNAATNVLTSSAGSGYGPAAATGSASLAASPLVLNVGASAAILNSQNNAGAVTATSVGTSYQVALNATSLPGTTGSTVGVTGNTLTAQAYGNSATNRVTQTALNTGAPSAAIGNYQVNSGAVTASVTSVTFGVGVSGGVGNSTLRTTGNQITASATGNSAVSSIASR